VGCCKEDAAIEATREGPCHGAAPAPGASVRLSCFPTTSESRGHASGGLDSKLTLPRTERAISNQSPSSRGGESVPSGLRLCPTGCSQCATARADDIGGDDEQHLLPRARTSGMRSGSRPLSEACGDQVTGNGHQEFAEQPRAARARAGKEGAAGEASRARAAGRAGEQQVPGTRPGGGGEAIEAAPPPAPRRGVALLVLLPGGCSRCHAPFGKRSMSDLTLCRD
jgi:hypothetical protein